MSVPSPRDNDLNVSRQCFWSAMLPRPMAATKKPAVRNNLPCSSTRLTSPPVRLPGVMSALYQKWTGCCELNGLADVARFLLQMRVRAGQSPASLPHIRHSGGRIFSAQPGAGRMSFSGESFFIIFTILFAGLIIGWLSDMIVQRTRFGFDGIIAIVIVGAVIGGGLTFALGDAIQMAINFPLTKAPKEIDISIPPPFERVVLPLAPLRPLLKPVVYRTREEICDALIEAVRNNDLPAHFFIRLLYQESSFRPYAISSAGALGIA